MTEVVRHLPAILRPYYLAEAIGVAEAARQAGKSMRTMREWCACTGSVGSLGGRWAISQVALDMLLDGDIESLEAYLNGDRTSERVRSYYVRRSIPLQSVSAGSPIMPMQTEAVISRGALKASCETRRHTTADG
jgi:hypothetical protein